MPVKVDPYHSDPAQHYRNLILIQFSRDTARLGEAATRWGTAEQRRRYVVLLALGFLGGKKSAAQSSSFSDSWECESDIGLIDWLVLI